LLLVSARNFVIDVPVVEANSFVLDDAFPTRSPVNVAAAIDAEVNSPVLG